MSFIKGLFRFTSLRLVRLLSEVDKKFAFIIRYLSSVHFTRERNLHLNLGPCFRYEDCENLNPQDYVSTSSKKALDR